MSNDDLKRILAEHSVEMRRHFDVAVEDIKSSNKIVAEGVVSLTERVGRLEVKVDGLETKFDRLETQVQAIDTRLRTVETHVEAIDTRLRTVETKVDGLSSEMQTGFADLRSMIKFSHAELDRRIRTLEDGFADLQARVERLESSTH